MHFDNYLQTNGLTVKNNLIIDYYYEESMNKGRNCNEHIWHDARQNWCRHSWCQPHSRKGCPTKSFPGP